MQLKVDNKDFGVATLATPFYIKTDDNMEWPEDKMFYLLTADGMFLCRNHKWFRSCAPAKKGPSELVGQEPFVKLNYPLIPRVLVEKVIGFFHLIYKEKGWESAVLLVWNSATQQVEVIVPDQKASCASVKYEIPPLAPGLVLIGDMHSHCDFGASSSFTDEEDEMHRPGIHIIAGKLQHEPPELYCAAVVDGQRFEITPVKALFEGYNQRNTTDVPKEWLAKVTEKKYQFASNYHYGDYYTGDHEGLGNYGYSGHQPKHHHYPQTTDDDKRIIRNILESYLKGESPPTESELKQELFRCTKNASYLYCEEEAHKFVKHWKQRKAHYDKQAIKARS